MHRLIGLTLVVLGFFGGLAATRVPPAEGHLPPARETPRPPPPRPLTTEEHALLSAIRAAPPGRVYAPSDAAEKALARGRDTLATKGATLENPCEERGGFGCVARPLDAFFERLDALDERRADRHAVVLALGNSLIAADGIVDVVRQRLVERFGDGGRGLLLADRISEHALRRRTGYGSGFAPYYLSQGPSGALPFGLTGVNHVATGRSARTRFSLDGERRASVWLHGDPTQLEVLVDGEALPASPLAEGVVALRLPEGSERFELRAREHGLAVQGVVLERDVPGVVLDSVGLPAADSPKWLSADEGLVTAQLRARDPALVMVMLGGVENRRIAWGRYGDEDVRDALTRLLARLKRAAPDGSCLVVGPIDAVEGMLDERVLGRKVKPFTQREELARVIALEREVALESGCAFFDLFEAMGGSGSLRRFARHGALLHDHVHPRGFGLDILGELIADALLREWRDTATDVPRRRVALAVERITSSRPGVTPPRR